MDVFLANRSYCCVDIQQLYMRRPEVAGQLLESMFSYLAAGKLQPIQTVTTFAAEDIKDAVRYMQKGQHIGKVVIDMSSISEESTAVHATPKPLRFDPEGSYLLVGGLGGFGKSISHWMIEHGARHLTYLSRSAGASEEDNMFFQDLSSQGACPRAVQGSVANLNDVRKAIEASGKPLRGVLQMSMVLRDQSFSKMTYDDWIAVVEPKVNGTETLHEATKDLNLDFFLLFSSLFGVLGQPGQANYAAANSFLDAFVQYRQSLGLPASSINIPMLTDIGYVARNPTIRARMEAASGQGIGESELLGAIHLAILKSRPPVKEKAVDILPGGLSSYSTPAVFALGLRPASSQEDPLNQLLWKREKRLAGYSNFSPVDVSKGVMQSAGRSNTLTTLLASCKTDPTLLTQKVTSVTLAEEIGAQVFGFLLKSVDELDIEMSLDQVGLDSFVAIELRSWWRSTFGFEIGVLEMLGARSILQLGEHCAERLWKMVEREEGGGGNRVS